MSEATERVGLEQRFVEATKPTSLAEVVDRILAIIDSTEDGEITPDADAELDALNLALEAKAEAYGAARSALVARAKAFKELAAKYTEKAQAAERACEKLCERLLAEMDRLQTTKIRAKTCTAYVQETERVEGEDVEHWPDEYVRVRREPNKSLVKEKLKAGMELGFAWLGKSRNVRFR